VTATNRTATISLGQAITEGFALHKIGGQFTGIPSTKGAL
jgi:hypothetical protein